MFTEGSDDAAEVGSRTNSYGNLLINFSSNTARTSCCLSFEYYTEVLFVKDNNTHIKVKDSLWYTPIGERTLNALSAHAIKTHSIQFS